MTLNSYSKTLLNAVCIYTYVMSFLSQSEVTRYVKGKNLHIMLDEIVIAVLTHTLLLTNYL